MMSSLVQMTAEVHQTSFSKNAKKKSKLDFFKPQSTMTSS